jgi:uncharacterized protein (UPF0332 family)
MNIRKHEWEIWMENPKKSKKSFNLFLKRKLIKKEKEKNFLSKSHLKKAEHNLDFVNFLIEKNKFSDWAIIGCYYSIYHAASAILAKAGYSSKKHLSTLCALIEIYYIKEKELNKEDIKLFSKSSLNKEKINYFVYAKQMREIANYSISEEFNKTKANELKSKTLDFLNKCREILD